MGKLSLKITIARSSKVTKQEFDTSLTVFEVCRQIREKVPDAVEPGDSVNDYGLLKLDDLDPRFGTWLESARALEFYQLENNSVLDYKTKKRPLRVETLDMTIRTIIVDDSLNVKDLVKTVCARYGLNNPEEFSFIVKDEEGKFTKERPSMRNAKKMAAMKKNLHTDDELKWLSSDKSLRDQGVDEKEVVVLRKRYYFTDKNVDGNDPIQLGLLYVQSQNDIVEGTHPCTKDEAVKFAALQLQKMSGDYDEEKHKPASIIRNLPTILPKEYAKARGIERLIAQEWKHYYGLKEMDAKFRFIQLCRALKTYGVTFFLVKEKMKARNRLVPRLLGITRDSIMRVDETTKDVMTTWPLTTVKRWAASPNSFTLDFGEYHDSFYSVQTSEGETISQLIAGYIDIILKKKKASEKFIHDVDDEVTMIEDNIAPRLATQMQLVDQARHHVDQRNLTGDGVAGVARTGGEPSRGHMDGPQHLQTGRVPGYGYMNPDGAEPGALTQAQQALIANIDKALEKLVQVTASLNSASDLPALGRDSASIIWKQNTMDVSKQNVNSQLAAMLAATSSVLTMTREVSEIDYTAVGSAITTITSNLTELSKSGRMIAALLGYEGQDGSNLLKAAQDLTNATGKFLQQARPPYTGHHKPLLDTAGDVGNRGGNLLKHVGESEVDPATQDRIIQLAKHVGTATTELIGQAKNVATKCDDPSLTALVVQGAKDTATATQQLVTCTKVLVPCIDSPLCQEQLIEACKAVAYCVDKLVELAQKGCTQDEAALGSLGKSAGSVSTALKELIDYISHGMGQGGGHYDEVCEAILAAHDDFFSSVPNAGQMVKQAQGLAQATSELIKALKSDASKQTDASASQRLLDAAKQLAAATAKMVSAGSESARNLKDPTAQEALKKAAEDLRSITTTVASQAIKRKVIRKLEVAAKQTAAVCTQCIAAAQGAESTNRNTASQQQLISNCKVVADNIARLVQAVKTTMSNPDSPSAQLGLINAGQSMLQPAGKMVATAKAAVPTISDQAAAMQLGNFAKATASAIHELRTAVGRASEACGSLEIDSALDIIKGLGKDLVEAQKIAAAGKLLPLPGETAKECAEELGATSKTVGSNMAQLLTAANQGNESYTGLAARDTSNALRVLASSVRGVAAGAQDLQHKDEILSAAKKVMDQSVLLIDEAKAAVDNPNMPNKQSRLAQAARGVSQSLNQVVSCLPGPKHVDQALKDIARASQQIDPKNSIFGQKPDQSYQTLQNNLSQAAASLNAAASQLVASSKGSSEELAASATLISKRYEELLIAGLQLASCSSDAESQQEMLGYLKTISISSTKLLLAAKALAADPNAPNAKNLLAAAARLVTDSINTLINVCTSSAPGQKECDTALRNIQMVASVLDDPKEPVSDSSFFDCLDTVLDRSHVINESVTDISTSTREANHEKFCESIRNLSSGVITLTECSAHAAYLVGVSDPRSDPAIPGLVDQGQFARAQHSISLACQTLLNPACSQQQVLASATTIAKHTSQLCTVCKSASNNTNNPVAKKHFMNSAKDVANSTSNLVKKIKDLSSTLTPENREACSQSTKPLLEAVEALATFASSSEFASTPARISPQAHDAMTPILISGRNMISNSNSLISTSKTLVLHPDDQNLWQLLAQHSKSLTDSIRNLVNSIRNNSPGQKECTKAAGILNRAIGDIDRATLEGMQQNLPPRQEHSLAGFRDQLLNTIEQISDLIHPVTVAAKGEAENLGHSVTNLTSHFTSFANFSIGMASRVNSSADQQAILEQSKTLGEAALQLTMASKEAGGNKSATEAYGEVDQAAESMTQAIKDLTLTVQRPSDPYYNATDNIYKAVEKLDEPIIGDLEEDDYVRCQDGIFQGAKVVAKLAQDSLGKATGDQSEMIHIVTELASTYTQMSDNARKAIRLAETEEVSLRIKRSVAKLGSECIDFVKNSSVYSNLPNDPQARKSHTNSVRNVIEKVTLVMTALQAGSKGTQACINAISVIQGVVGDLETTVMFANAKTLNPESKESFGKHKEDLLGSCQKLVEETKRLVSSVQATQDELSKTALNCETHVQQLADSAKLAASALTEEDPEAQVLLLNAVKDVAISMGTLLEATKNASGKSRTDGQMLKLKDAAKSMVTSVTSLMKTITSVEDEAGRSQRAIETAIEAIAQSLTVFESRAPPTKKGTPEEMLNCSKELTKATAKTARAVLPGGTQKQEELTIAANDGRNAITSLLPIVKSIAVDIDKPELKLRCQNCGRDAATHYSALLEFVKSGTGKKDSQIQLRNLSHEVAQSISEIVEVAEAIKEHLGYAHPDNPAVMAERELLLAAAAIDMAARKLKEAKPISGDLPELSGEMKFEEAILHAAKAIARATRALVQAATDAQHELVKQGRMKSGYGDQDSIWSEGLVSAAKQVARSTSELCESANACVTSSVPDSQDRLVASAKAIAKHTAQLLMACRVKADPNSEKNLRLRRAGLEVKKATDTLVDAALENKMATAVTGDPSNPRGDRDAFKKELEMMSEVAKKERELEAARSALQKIERYRKDIRPQY